MPEEIKLEVGKFYRDERNHKIHIWGYNPHLEEYHGKDLDSTIDDDGANRIYTGDGDNIGHIIPFAIIAEWKEPKSVEMWIEVLFGGGIGLPWNGARVPDKPGYSACRKIRYTEGGKIEDITEEEV